MTFFIKKLKIDGNDAFLVTEFEDQKKLKVQILNVDENKAFCGDATELDLRSMAASIRMTYSNFLNDTLSALAFSSSNDTQFSYTLEKNDEVLKFKWKKIIESENIKVNLGNIEVKNDNFTSVLTSALSVLSQEFYNFSKKLDELNTLLQNSEKEKNDLHSALTEAVNIKENIEKELYTKFLLILNAKKRKIKELHEEIETLQASSSISTGQKHEIKRNLSDNSKRTCKRMSDSTNEPGPSKTVKKNLNSSLLFDDDDDDNSCLISKTRKPRIRTSGNKKHVDNKSSDSDEIKNASKISAPVNNNDSDNDSDDLFGLL